MKKLLGAFGFILFSSLSLADIDESTSFIYDSSGHALSSTSNALNSFLTNSTLAVTQSGSWTNSCTQGTTPWVNNVTQFGSSNVVNGTGTSGSGIPRVTVSNDSKIVAWDGTNTTTIKPASTAPAATDTAFVVGLSPNGNQSTDTTLSAFKSANHTDLTSTEPRNVSQFGGNNVVTGIGASGVGIPRMTVSNDSEIKIWDGTNNVGPNQSGNSIIWMPVVAAPVDGYKATYSAVISNLTVAAAPTDVITIQGSATKIVRILHIDYGNTQNVATTNDVLLILRSSADTGGTSATVSSVAHDQNNAAATVVVKKYTANPSALGTAIGILRANQIFGSTATTAAQTYGWDFGTRPDQAVVLRGTSEFLVVNLNAQAFVGSSLDVNIEWTEE